MYITNLYLYHWHFYTDIKSCKQLKNKDSGSRNGYYQIETFWVSVLGTVHSICMGGEGRGKGRNQAKVRGGGTSFQGHLFIQKGHPQVNWFSAEQRNKWMKICLYIRGCLYFMDLFNKANHVEALANLQYFMPVLCCVSLCLILTW